MNENFTFDLQCFADGGTEGGDETTADAPTADNTTEGSGNDTADTKGDEEKAAEAEAKLQKKIDDAVARAQKKWETEYKKKAEAEKKEAERLSKLSDDERRKAELETSRRELEAKEQELQRKELKLEMVKVLAERKIPVEFMDYFITDDSESTLKRITDFEKAYNKAIEDAVTEKLKGKPPTAGGNNGKTGNNPAVSVKNGFFEAITKNQSKR